MRQVVTALIAAVGVTVFVGGLCAFLYGLVHAGPTIVTNLGPLDGLWPAEKYCFCGGVLAAIGSGLATFGFALRSRA